MMRAFLNRLFAERGIKLGMHQQLNESKYITTGKLQQQKMSEGNVLYEPIPYLAQK